jgi:hypothetical protein
MGTAWQSDAFQSDAFQQYGQVAAAPTFLAAWAANANVFIEHVMKKNVASQVIGAQLVSASDGSAFTGAVTVYVTGDGGTQAAGSVGAGACTHEGNGFHTYLPAQAETNYDHIAFTFVGSGAVPSTVQMFTTFPQTGDNFTRLGAPAGASVSADIAAVKSETATILADTNELQTDWANGGRLDNILDARASQASVDDLPTNAELATALGTADDAVLAAVATVDTVVDAIKAKTDNLPASPAATGDIPTATQNADALLNRDMSAVSDTNSRSPLNALRFIRNRWAVGGTTLTVYEEDDTTAAWTAEVSTSAGADPVIGSDPA